jgi:polyhydroxyalkanoic acid synthase PhaR subunit
MSNNNSDFDPFDPTGMLKNMRDASMDSWAKLMTEVVNTDAYAQATGAMLDAWLTSSGPFQKALKDNLTQALTNINLPVRDDVTRLAERFTNIEMRLDDLEAKLDESLRQTRGSEQPN